MSPFNDAEWFCVYAPFFIGLLVGFVLGQLAKSRSN